MGIADQMKDKTKHPPAGGNSANLVVSGEAELARAAGTGSDVGHRRRYRRTAAGDLNNVTMYSAGAATGSKQADAGKALVNFLHSPEAQAVFKARGLKPEGTAAKAS